MLQKDVKATSPDGSIAHNQVLYLASLELTFELYNIDNDNLHDIIQQTKTRGVPLSLLHKFEITALSNMSCKIIMESTVNIKRAHEDSVSCLHHEFPLERISCYMNGCRKR